MRSKFDFMQDATDYAGLPLVVIVLRLASMFPAMACLMAIFFVAHAAAGSGYASVGVNSLPVQVEDNGATWRPLLVVEETASVGVDAFVGYSPDGVSAYVGVGGIPAKVEDDGAPVVHSSRAKSRLLCESLWMLTAVASACRAHRCDSLLTVRE